MIELTRVRDEFAIVPSFRGDKPVERLVDLMTQRRDKLAAGDDPKLKIPSRWSVTKKQLLKETHNKCAYCESHTTVVAFGDVEHYRPKSVYWWLAYVYDNYLASCSICNQQFKSDDFEFTGPRMAGPEFDGNTTDAEIAAIAKTTIPDPLDVVAVAAFKDAHLAEAPLIPNPYFDKPERFFAWDVLVGAKEVELIPNHTQPRAAEIVESSVKIYGLNRTQLKRRRFKQWERYNFFLRTLQDEGANPELRADAQSFIDSQLEADSEYAAMVRYFEKQRGAG